MPTSPPQDPDAPADSLIPAPTSAQAAVGWWRITGTTTITCDPGARASAELLRDYLVVTGLPLPLAPAQATTTSQATSLDGEISLSLSPSDPELGGEGYRLDVDERGVRICAESPAGLRHGVQTLRQLLPATIYAARPPAGVDWRVPFVRISDRPRFSWRGSLLDVGRWHLPVEYLHRYVELLAVHKMNRLHLHLTDDQGWRFEVTRYPDLTAVGAWRAESPAGHARDGRGDGRSHGGFYTQQELRELVEFAARRGVEVMPEIDLPGHVTAAIAAYPRLGNGTAPMAVSTRWGVHDRVLNVHAGTVQFCRDVLDEVMEVFPARWVHLGGDECPTTEWAASPSAGRRVRELGLSGVQDLQEWFLNRLCAHVHAQGRTPVVWDEAFTAGLHPSAVVMAWRDEAVGVAAAAAGRDVVMAPQQRTYFDHHQDDGPDQPLAIGGLTRLRDVVDYDPAPASMTDGSRRRVLGTQGQLWTEYLPTPARVDEMAYPRLAALAERAWSRSPTSYPEFRSRLAQHAERLEHAGVRWRALS
jgi:hexosaminidase